MNKEMDASLLITETDYQLLQALIADIQSIDIDNEMYLLEDIPLDSAFYTNPAVLDALADQTRDPFDEDFVRGLKDAPILIHSIDDDVTDIIADCKVEMNDISD